MKGKIESLSVETLNKILESLNQEITLVSGIYVNIRIFLLIIYSIYTCFPDVPSIN